MGLDLILYKHIKDGMTFEELQSAELAYGRKTWTIAEFFQKRCDPIEGDWYFKMAEADWDEFMVSLEKLNDSAFREKVENFITWLSSADIDIEWTPAQTEEYDEIEAWYDSSLNNSNGYTLGFDWELEAALRWFDADKEVREAFKNGEDVRLIVSY